MTDLNFKEITFNPARSIAAKRNLVWSRLILSFEDAETGHVPSIELTLLQTANPSATISELEKEATNRAKTILREALAVLEANDVTSLLDSQAAAD